VLSARAASASQRASDQERGRAPGDLGTATMVVPALARLRLAALAREWRCCRWRRACSPASPPCRSASARCTA
jgi:hypothetical protein